ncbi:hypothetical protein ACF07D_02930 [Leucobacter sp. NPDC015123]|uniref:hypothetical protein n=1 Tax=Leucobacter sp. NPDC015123 TaxID=3364129 RepID=UPI0036F47655
MSKTDHRALLGLRPEDLDGVSIEELSEYLDNGRTPPNPRIEASAGCQRALDALQRIGELSPLLLDADAAAEPLAEDSWVQGVLAGIALDVHAGRRIPIVLDSPATDAGITEGALRGLIRRAERAAPGTLVGKCTFAGDITEPNAPVRVAIELSVPYGAEIHAAADAVRAEIRSLVASHTTVTLTDVDIVVRDVQPVNPQIVENT